MRFSTTAVISAAVAILAMAVSEEAVAQTAISADGIVESTSGGFRFPDGTVQTGAATDDGVPVFLVGTCPVADDAANGVGLIFTVPPGKRLKVRFVSFAAHNLGFSESLLPLLRVGSGQYFFEEMVGGNHYPALGPSLTRTATQLVHMDAAAGENVSCEVWTSLNSGSNRQLKVGIAGYLVDEAP